ncbi:MAG TPA: nucleotidyltransferase [Myxococcota bacterium]|nr:nucleotidyltransferase [Myxococcota bacterium]
MLPGACSHEGSSGDPAALAEVLSRSVGALEGAEVPYLLIGGLASAVLGRPRCSSDVDLLVAPEAAPRALEALSRAGFETEITNPAWLYKAFSNGILVDLLFKTTGDIYLDRDMLRRGSHHSFLGTRVRVVAPEDLIVIKALVHDEETPRHWHDALALLRRRDLDWEYLVERAQRGPRRVLSLLVYALSSDLWVPSRPVRRLAEQVLFE